MQEARFAHLVGAARMGNDPSTSVVDEFGRTHDIANLFVCDGSILPTQGSANPGLTIQALAARTADYLISQGTTIFNSDRRDMTAAARPPRTFSPRHPRPRSPARGQYGAKMKPKIEILKDETALARCVADKMLEQAARGHSRAGSLHLGPYGRRLARASLSNCWRKIRRIAISRGERPSVSLAMSGMSHPDHRTSNYLQARKKLFHTGLVPEENIFRFHARNSGRGRSRRRL